MPVERSAGAIVFRETSEGREYLLIKHRPPYSHWDFPKGHIEAGESEKDTAKREVKEEAGLNGTVEKELGKIKYWFYSEEDKVRLFEPDFSTKKTGSGLGLTIVNTIIADHKGVIRVHDNYPTGAKFIIELPVK